MIVIQDFQTSLLREKFTIYNPDKSDDGADAVVAMSNRIVIRLSKSEDENAEELVIRTQNMHSCVRFAARLIQSYYMGGSILNRAQPYDWDASWDFINNEYERRFNEELWGVVYCRGKIVFQSGDHHNFLDLIEKCEESNQQEDYDYAIPLAEKAFKQTGQNVKINYDANVALVATFEGDEARFGVILRGPDATTTFNYRVLQKSKDEDGNRAPISIPQCLTVSAAFLEGVQLSFSIGTSQFKLRSEMIEKSSDENKRMRESQKRLGRLNAEIANLDNNFDVRYRPDKPDFYKLVTDAEELAFKTIGSQDS
ncbi:MAG: hypothetical protein AB8B83_07145 [Bdellovibrionales bacterium]